MDEAALRTLFRRVLWTCLAPPLAVAAGCSDGGSSAGRSLPSDAGRDVTLVDAAEDGPTTDAAVPEDSAVRVPVDAEPDAVALDASDAARDADAGTAPDGGYTCTPNTQACVYFVPASCADGGFPADAAALQSAECAALCGEPAAVSCDETVAPGGVLGVECYPCAAAGRRPAGYRPRVCADRPRVTALGRYFAHVAELEAASIRAFRDVAGELAAHGAPARLCAEARRAARDETRHARVTSKLARRHGGVVRRAAIAPAQPRTLEAFAVENAVEGCVRETYGALIAHFAAQHAGDPDVRGAMDRIAIDETRHAALGWAIDAWARQMLGAPEKRRVDRAMRRAVRDLWRESSVEPSADLRDGAGLPSAREGRRFVAELARALWSDRTSERPDDHARA